MVACTRTEFRGNVLECVDGSTNNSIVLEVSMDFKTRTQLDIAEIHRRVVRLEASQTRTASVLSGNLVLMALLFVLLVVLPVFVGTSIN